MSRERHARAKELFLAACNRPPDERREFLERSCGDDEALLQEVQSLLQHHDGSSSGDRILDGTGGTPRRFQFTGAFPKTLGKYRVLRKLGEGGMGEVYEAEQTKPVRRRVALKLIKWGMDTKEVVARFESERQALALMNHPSIASVFDAGATEGGRPYFAMEHVPGEPITDYCDDHRLTVRKRLDLFLQVCEGVQHAHQKGIIHRDIKPSNILVTTLDDKPVPKIIDFGIAKATSWRLTERSLYTELGQWVGTPEYMSPEQAEWSGSDIDTRTDVYSLGVVLYELLVGTQPFAPTELRGAGFEGVRRILREEEPPNPSTRVHSLGKTSTHTAENRRVDLPALERELRGDLDWITMKALEKDRTRRYGSPSELAEDIRRHLRDEPVVASPPSQVYRLKKFVRRHRLGAAVGVALFLVVSGVALMMTLQTARVRRERDRAEREAAKAQAINEFLQETLGSADPYGELGREVTVVEALGEAVARIDEAFEDQPEIEAAVRTTIGNSYRRLGRYDEAEALLASALEIRERLFGEEHLDVAESLLHLGAVWVERAQREDLIRAERHLKAALDIRRRLRGPDSLEVAEALRELGLLRYESSELEEAEELYRRSVAIRRARLADDRLVAATLANLAVALHAQGRLDEAIEQSREALAIARRVGRRDVISEALNNLALHHRESGDYATAESYMRETLALDRSVLGDAHPIVTADIVNLASVLNLKGDHDAAAAAAREGLGRYDPDFWGTAVASRVLADALAGMGQYREAEPLYLDAIRIFRESHGEDHIRTAVARRGYGAVLASTGRYQAAEEELLFALPVYRDYLGAGTARVRSLLDDLVELYETWGKPEEAAEYRSQLDEVRP